MKATMMVVNSSRKSSTHKWTTQNRQKSPIAKLDCERQAIVPAGTLSFTYNAEGQRVVKTSYDGSVTGFLYDFKRLLQETEGYGAGSAIDKTYTSAIDDEYGDVLSEGDAGLTRAASSSTPKRPTRPSPPKPSR
jgi:YD repeat-containing protein